MENIISKIEKLLALAQKNPNENEAMSAAAKAQELMAKYNIQMDQLEADEKSAQKIGTATHSEGKGYKWRYTLAGIIARNFRCKYYMIGHDQIVFYGFEHDAKIALQTFSFLFKVGNRLATRAYTKYKNEGGYTKGFLNTYLTGFCDGIASVLDEQCKALMIVIPKEVNAAYTEYSKNFRHCDFSFHSSHYDSGVYNCGHRDGRDTMQSRYVQ